MVSWLQQDGRWHDASSGYIPQPGDIVVFHKNNNPSHVGIVVSVETTIVNGETRVTALHTIEGNTWPRQVHQQDEEGVMERTYHSPRAIYGYGRLPDNTTQVTPTTPEVSP